MSAQCATLQLHVYAYAFKYIFVYHENLQLYFKTPLKIVLVWMFETRFLFSVQESEVACLKCINWHWEKTSCACLTSWMLKRGSSALINLPGQYFTIYALCTMIEAHFNGFEQVDREETCFVTSKLACLLKVNNPAPFPQKMFFDYISNVM